MYDEKKSEFQDPKNKLQKWWHHLVWSEENTEKSGLIFFSTRCITERLSLILMIIKFVRKMKFIKNEKQI